jgi:hypothetical protein
LRQRYRRRVSAERVNVRGARFDWGVLFVVVCRQRIALYRDRGCHQKCPQKRATSTKQANEAISVCVETQETAQGTIDMDEKKTGETACCRGGANLCPVRQKVLAQEIHRGCETKELQQRPILRAWVLPRVSQTPERLSGFVPCCGQTKASVAGFVPCCGQAKASATGQTNLLSSLHRERCRDNFEAQWKLATAV